MMRRTLPVPIFQVTISIVLLLIIVGCSKNQIRNTSEIDHIQGEMSGEVTDTSVLLQSRLTATSIDSTGDVPGRRGVARFEIARDSSFDAPVQTEWLRAEEATDFIVRARVRGLQPGTRYYYRLVFGSDERNVTRGPVRRFRTNPGPDELTGTNFVVVTGMHYARFRTSPRGQGPDRELGFPALVAIRNLKPDFFIGTGDNVYYDHDPRVESRQGMRKKWHEQFVQPRFVQLFSEVPAYWEKDDHDYRFDDADTTTSELPGHRLGLEIFREQVPVVDWQDNTAVTYRTHRIGRLVQIWLLEGRDYRSPNAMPDGPGKTIWGDEQREWLKRTLLESTAPFKIVISPTPLVGPDDLRKKDNHTNIGGFRHEGTNFLEWAKENGFLEKDLFFICGDRHWQYHSIHPTGFEEFSTGALVDGNSRLGVSPGDLKGTDPDSLIRQPFTSPEPSGGFLHVSVNPGSDSSPHTLEFNFYDENGRLIYDVTRSASGT